MLGKSLSLRVAGPTILVSLLLLGLCIVGAAYLYAQQARSGEILGENVDSARIAHDLENTLQDLLALLRKRNDQVEPLHQRVRDQLAEAQDLADKDTEKQLVARLEDSWERYLEQWRKRKDDGKEAEEQATREAMRILQTEALPICGELRSFNARAIRESEQEHRRTVNGVLAGLIATGCVGALAGLLLGYGVARGLRHSIHRLSIRVRDAADRLGQDLPPVILTEDGDLQHLHAQMEDLIHEIERVVEELQQREREVLRADQLRAVGQLAAGVAHELRNPLTSIKMLIQANREEAAARRLPEDDLQIIEREIRRMERSLQNFLDFARQPRPQRRPLDLAQPLERTRALIAGRARKQNVEVRVLQPEAPALIEADADQVQQLLVNLTLNALDVMPRGGTLEIEVRPPEHGQVELRVSDTGPGIAPDMLPRLFRPFVSSKETGLGLGLVISQRIAESHGGSLRALNRPEGGACFIVRLPVPVRVLQSAE
jgi:signal transduction histidine kinase